MIISTQIGVKSHWHYLLNKFRLSSQTAITTFPFFALCQHTCVLQQFVLMDVSNRWQPI